MRKALACRRGTSIAMCALVMALPLSGCFTETITGPGAGGSSNEDPPQCQSDADCAGFDTDQDACTAASCQAGKCTQRLIRNTTDCQCHTDADCSYYQKDCSTGTCAAHRCSEKIAPAGPAPTQKEGDCSTLLCDGTTAIATKQEDLTDLPKDDNPCTVESCSATGPKQTGLPDGTSCGDGVCFQGRCLVCKPRDPTSCGGEGADEPKNDSGATASAFQEQTPICAFSSGSDIDWYTFYAKDADLSHDVFAFKLWSTAPTMEVCIYVKCEKGGVPGGGCASKLPGPGGSQGCCWTGAPSTLQPSWDLDCPGTTEDSGTAYVSVRTPGASACESYAITGGY